MFVDEKKAGEDQTRADPFTLESLIAWLEKQPAEKEYDYVDPGKCLLCQYFTDMGMPSPRVCFNFVKPFRGAVETEFPIAMKFAAQGDGLPRQWTFGAALERACALRDQK